MKRRILTGAVILAVAACGKDDGTGPADEVSFPALAAATTSLFCIRGTAIPPSSRTGTITQDDCDDGASFFDTWRVRVKSSGSVTFTVSSQFDSYLVLRRIDSLSDPAFSSVLLAYDNDSADGQDAQLTYSLQPDTEYWIAVSGYDYTGTGPYSLNISQ
ncbi:MAG: hypothetical protein FIB01_02045 [Gemmatimonadetes bacterium]|nr:hypothetical protein [Gemmatimonadota bacterium]